MNVPEDKTPTGLKNLRHHQPEDRLKAVAAQCQLSTLHTQALEGNSALPIAIADGMIENVIGRFEVPLGVATNFRVNNRDYLIPMAVEEPSVVAAASFMAKLVKQNGGFITSSTAPIMRGQIQLLNVQDLAAAKSRLLACLLYTSPSPRDLSTSRMPSSA